MKVYILHTEAGEIRSVVHAEEWPGLSAPIVPATEGEAVAEIPAEGIAVDLSPLEIHENYRFDVKRGRLVRKSAKDEG